MRRPGPSVYFSSRGACGAGLGSGDTTTTGFAFVKGVTNGSRVGASSVSLARLSVGRGTLDALVDMPSPRKSVTQHLGGVTCVQCGKQENSGNISITKPGPFSEVLVSAQCVFVHDLRKRAPSPTTC